MFIKAIDNFMIDRIFQSYFQENKKHNPKTSAMALANSMFIGVQVMSVAAAVYFAFFVSMNAQCAEFIAGLTCVILVARYLTVLCDQHRIKEVRGEPNPFRSMIYSRFLVNIVGVVSFCLLIHDMKNINPVMVFLWGSIYLFGLGLHMMACDLNKTREDNPSSMDDDGDKVG